MSFQKERPQLAGRVAARAPSFGLQRLRRARSDARYQAAFPEINFGKQFKLSIPLLALVLLTSCAPPVFVERAFQAGKSFQLEWQATGKSQQLWLDVRTTGGRSLHGPVTVYSAEQQVASGTFSLAHRGIRGKGSSFVQNWVSTPNGARGQVRLFNLPNSPAGTRMKVTIQLDPGPGVAVEKLALQVRSKSEPSSSSN